MDSELIHSLLFTLQNSEDEKMQLKKKKRGKSKLPCTVFFPLMMVLLLLILTKDILVAAKRKVGGNAPFLHVLASVKPFFFFLLSLYVTLCFGKTKMSYYLQNSTFLF